MPASTRRVVTGLDPEGRSTIILDGPSPCQVSVPNMGVHAQMLWTTNEMPADNSGNADVADGPWPSNIAPPNGTTFYIFEYAPGAGGASSREDGTKEPGSGMHATATIDYIVILSGEMTFITEAGETVLRAGDTVVDRGVAHAWENRGSAPVLMASITIDAKPLIKGQELLESM